MGDSCHEAGWEPVFLSFFSMWKMRTSHQNLIIIFLFIFFYQMEVFIHKIKKKSLQITVEPFPAGFVVMLGLCSALPSSTVSSRFAL